MERLVFNPSQGPTIGVEVELALIDAQSMALTSAGPMVLERVPPELNGSIKPELMQCYVEINSDIGRTIDDVQSDLRQKIMLLEGIAGDLGLCLLWSGTHPFSSWRDQEVTENARYYGLVQLLQDTARQLVTFGLHVHVGVDSGDKAVMICDRIMRHLPTLLAASCNSPFWDGRSTGLQSWRSRVMEGLPTAGLPPLMRNWSEYVWLIKHLIETGYIETIREIWWDVRPHHNFGTVEVRICDIPGSLTDTLALAATVQCLVKRLSDEIDQGAYQHDSHPMIVRQNKWRAARYGLDAQLVDPLTFEMKPARQVIEELVALLRPMSQALDCQPHLDRMLHLASAPTWARRQVDLLAETGSSVEVVRRLIRGSRLAPAPSLGQDHPPRRRIHQER